MTTESIRSVVLLGILWGCQTRMGKDSVEKDAPPDSDSQAPACHLEPRPLSEADATFDGFLSSIAGAGDFNADGYFDVVVGNSYDDAGGMDGGAAILLMGGATPMGGSLAAVGVQFTNTGDYGYAGWSTGGAGDVNADGFDDILIGGRREEDNENRGAVWLLLGSAVPAGAPLAEAGILFEGKAEDNLRKVSGAGDSNGDGYADFLLGAHTNSEGGETYSGAVYLHYGEANPGSTAPLVYTGSQGEHLGAGVAGAGDVDADGFDDLLIGADYYTYGDLEDPGAVYLVLGSNRASSAAIADIGFRYIGGDDDEVGEAIAGAGDVNGDGHADFVVGSPQANTDAGNDSGEAYLFFGSSSPSPGPLEDAPVTYEGGRYTWSGSSVAGAGDVDGDGFGDLLIGAPTSRFEDEVSPEPAGAFLIYGSAQPAPGLLSEVGVAFTDPGAGTAVAGGRRGRGWLP